MALDPTSILAVGHCSHQITADAMSPDGDADCDTEILNALGEHDFRPGLSPLVGNIVCCIAGFVVRKAIARLSCSTCEEALISRQEPADLASHYHLLRLKDRGGLVTPSEGVLKVILTAEEELRRRSQRLDSAQRTVQRRVLESAVLGRIGTDCVWAATHWSLSTAWRTITRT